MGTVLIRQPVVNSWGGCQVVIVDVITPVMALLAEEDPHPVTHGFVDHLFEFQLNHFSDLDAGDRW